MINVENLDSGSEKIGGIPDIILVDNTYGQRSPDVLASGVDLALKFGFSTLYLPDLSDDEIEKIDKYRKHPQDKLRDDINKILRKHYSRDPNAINSYWEIIGSPISLEGNSEKIGMLSHNQKKVQAEIKAKVDHFRSDGKRVIIFTGSMYNSFLERAYRDNNEISFFRLRGVKNSEN